jgi:hypothetical protein
LLVQELLIAKRDLKWEQMGTINFLVPARQRSVRRMVNPRIQKVQERLFA